MELSIQKKISSADILILGLPIGGETCDGILYLFKKKDDKFSREIIAPCIMGKNGITSDKKEGDLKTPIGVFDLDFAFGINDNPGTGLDYVKLSDTMYWVDDVDSEYYNKLVDISKTDADFNSGEHMIDYPGLYDYGIAVGYNKECVSGRGSAIFLHCKDKIKDHTCGCIAVDKAFMVEILKAINEYDKPIIAILDDI